MIQMPLIVILFCALLDADIFLLGYERDFMMSLSDDEQAEISDAFDITSRYLDDILTINNIHFDNMLSQKYPSELQLNKVNTSDTEAAFSNLHLSISNDMVSTKIYDKRDDFFYFEMLIIHFEIVMFLALHPMQFIFPNSPDMVEHSHVAYFNIRNKLLTQKLLKEGYRYHK